MLENPIRRKILAKLSKEQHYPLQLSKELNISQQAIMKHLKVLEENGLVVSFEEKSTLGGPPRKSYVSKKSISLRIDIGPNTFNTELYDYKELDSNGEMEKEKDQDKEYNSFEDKYEGANNIEEPNEKLKEFSKIIKDIDQELEKLKLKRSKLLNLREHVMEESNDIIKKLCQEYNERKILYYVITHSDRDISTISEAMEMRERVIEDIFNNLVKQRLISFFKDDF